MTSRCVLRHGPRCPLQIDFSRIRDERTDYATYHFVVIHPGSGLLSQKKNLGERIDDYYLTFDLSSHHCDEWIGSCQ